MGTIRRLCFALWALFLVGEALVLCYCPGIGICMAVFMLFPLIAGPRLFHRITAALCLTIGVSIALGDYRNPQREIASLARMRALVAAAAATQAAAAQSTAPSPPASSPATQP